jgi:hypothetical protein
MDTIKKPASKQQQISEVRRHNWEVMKPFVKFSITALGIIGYALISLIKHLPKPERHQDQKNKLIKL